MTRSTMKHSTVVKTELIMIIIIVIKLLKSSDIRKHPQTVCMKPWMSRI